VVQAGASSSYSAVASLLNAGGYSVIVSNETGISVTSAPVNVAVYSIPGGYPGVVIGSGPVNYYRLGELSGTTAFDTIGGVNGTYNSATLGLPGYSVLDSDTAAGFSGNNSYVGNISGTAINFTGHTNFTLEAWVNAPAGQNDEATIIAKGIGANGTTRTEQFSLDVAGGAYRFFTTAGTTLYEADASSGPNGSWQHVVGVYDDNNILGGGSNMYIYVNGVLEGQGKVRPAGLNNTVSPVSIGSKRTGNDPTYDGTFDGTVDEVAIYNYPLSASTILAHYAAAYGPSMAPFITVQPVPTTNYAGLPAKLTVSAAGTVPLHYTWKKNPGNVTVGTDSDTLAFTPLGFSDQASYSVAITNGINPGIISVSVPLVVLPPPATPPAIAGLVLHLPFDTNLVDVTGRGNNGTGQHYTDTATNTLDPNPGIPGTFYYVPDGVLGSALHYSTYATNSGGTTSIGVDDYFVSIGYKPDLQFSSNVSFTVSYWVRLPLGYQGGDLPFFTDALGALGNNGYVFAPAYGYGTADSNPNPAPLNTGAWGTSIYGGGNGVRYYGDSGSINDNNWHHLVHVVDRTAGILTTYLDGAVAHAVKIAGTTITSAGSIDTTNSATIGQDPSGRYGETATADIDDLGVWRTALTPLQVGSIYIAAISNQMSYVSGPIVFTRQTLSPTQFKLTWNAGTLQSASNVLGPYSNVTPVSPFTVTVTNAAQQYYRVKL
jgi:hypothetical protein